MRKVLPVLCGCLVLATAFAVAQPYIGFNNKPTANKPQVANAQKDFTNAVNSASQQYLNQINQQVANQIQASQAAQAKAQSNAASAAPATNQPNTGSATTTTTVTTSPTQPANLPRPTTAPTSAPVMPNYSITNTAPQPTATGGANSPAQTQPNSSIYTGFGSGGNTNSVTTAPGQTNSNAGSNWNIKY